MFQLPTDEVQILEPFSSRVEVLSQENNGGPNSSLDNELKPQFTARNSHNHIKLTVMDSQLENSCQKGM